MSLFDVLAHVGTGIYDTYLFRFLACGSYTPLLKRLDDQCTFRLALLRAEATYRPKCWHRFLSDVPRDDIVTYGPPVTHMREVIQPQRIVLTMDPCHIIVTTAAAVGGFVGYIADDRGELVLYHRFSALFAEPGVSLTFSFAEEGMMSITLPRLPA